MNTLLEPPGYPFSSRYHARLMHAKHPVFRLPNVHALAIPRSPRRALPCLAF
ncbi:hypothetical protein PS914_02268 [Pseudomonas fluorescens]|uniref:Uncharacterized protein n=1 Tax=Pseudomonas fluorescens TaxID=294 RepID=A0A5E7S4Y5_PSEFL|nr:hypothetical protein PS833_00526 [Pseudomonas fluorescens]VVP81792.1 hypothetical protein PS914_02268 [Pseudomonas fluorescens]